MNPDINDPVLQALAARLASVAPQISVVERNDLLYQCAYSAGRSQANRRLRRWQATAAVLGVLLLGINLPLASSRWVMAKNEPQIHQSPPPTFVEAVPSPAEMVRPSILPVDTGAWRLAQAPHTMLPDD